MINNRKSIVGNKKDMISVNQSYSFFCRTANPIILSIDGLFILFIVAKWEVKVKAPSQWFYRTETWLLYYICAMQANIFGWG